MSDTLKSDLNDVISALLEAGLGLKSTHVAAVEKAIAELDRLEAEMKRPRYSGELPQPMFWAYRYHDCIRFNGGSEVNGSRPIEAIPLYTAEQMRAFLTTPDVVPSTEPVQAAGDEALLPCPFCGGEALPHRVPGLGQLWRVTCKNCDAAPHGKFSREDAQSAWNHRAPAETSDQGQRSQTPTKQGCKHSHAERDPEGGMRCMSCKVNLHKPKAAEKPKPVSLVETFDLIRKHNPLTGVEAAVREALAVADERFRTLDQERVTPEKSR